jgi:thiol-disulfide isomerase/thioredoxin
MASPSNYHVVESPESLQELLGSDLSAVSVLNFRADWAEPCRQMDAVAKELAGKYPKTLFLEVRTQILDSNSAHEDSSAMASDRGRSTP